LTNIDGLRPYFCERDVIQLGEKLDANSPDYFWKDFPQTAIRRFPIGAVKEEGVTRAMTRIADELAAEDTHGFWLHVDFDVLDPTLMPAVDSPDPGGCDWEELDIMLTALLRHPKLTGVDFAIYDPTLDLTGEYGSRIAALLQRHLQRLSH
jgi:arginase